MKASQLETTKIYQHHRSPHAESFSEEVDSRSSRDPKEINNKNKKNDGGATIEMVKRLRGRPPGSKNKPKPPVVITRESADEPSSSAFRPHVIEVPSGRDVADSLAAFSRLRGIGICILAATGTVANVTLRHPSPSPAASVSFGGPFEILSISAAFLPPSIAASGPCGFSISLAGPRGQIIGGTVVGPLVAAGTVVVVAAAFVNPTFHRIPEDDEAPAPPSLSGSGNEAGAQHQEDNGSDRNKNQYQEQEEQEDQFHHQYHHHRRPSASDGMSVYGGHFPYDVIWAPTARPPQPRPPPY